MGFASETQRRLVQSTAILGFALSVSMPAQAQSSASSAGIDDIIVTAQRREQNLQDVGVSITALTAKQIQELGVTSSADVGRIAPGVVFAATTAGGSFASMSVRGISQSDFSPIQEAPNSIYLDDVYLSANGAAGFPTYDLERIEVLRGPQGTLFGRNSTGGLAHFITAKPTDTFQGYAELGYGRFNDVSLEAAVSGPLSDKMRARLSGKIEKADGWWKNMAVGGKDSMETNAFGLRGQVEFDATDNILARVSLSYDKQPQHRVGTYKSRNFYLGEDGLPVAQPETLDVWGTGPGNTAIGYRDPYPDAQTSAFDNYGFSTSRRFSPTLFLQWSGDATTVTSVTNYTDFSINYLEETDGTPIDYVGGGQQQKLKQWSQEVRASGKSGPLFWTAGIYFLDIDTTAIMSFFFPLLSGSPDAFGDFQDIKQHTQSWAPFGQVEWAFNDRLKLTAGLRYTHDRKTFSGQVYLNDFGDCLNPETGSTACIPPIPIYDFQASTVGNLARQKKGLWSGKVQLDYKPNEDVLLYAGVSRGVKGAGFNTNLSGGMTNEETPFRSEAVMAYEVGSKLEFLDKALRLNSSLYFYDYSNYQGYAFNGTQGVVGNYQGRFYGGDVELQANLPADIRMSFGASYSHTKLKDIPTAYAGVRDQEAVMAPKWVLNGSLRKSFNLGDGRLGLNWMFDYQSRRYASVENNAATRVAGSIVNNARVTYELPDKGVELAAFVNNVFDVDRQLFVYDFIAAGGFTINIYDKPRWWGVSARKRF